MNLFRKMAKVGTAMRSALGSQRTFSFQGWLTPPDPEQPFKQPEVHRQDSE